MPGKFNFTIFGGLDKQFYTRFRELRKKYDLDDRGLIECMIWMIAIDQQDLGTVAPFHKVVEEYKATAPVDITVPEVV